MRRFEVSDRAVIAAGLVFASVLIIVMGFFVEPGGAFEERQRERIAKEEAEPDRHSTIVPYPYGYYPYGGSYYPRTTPRIK